MKRTLTSIFLLFLFSSFAFANGIIKGTVTDKKTAEPLIGATVHIKNKKTGFKLSISTGLDGSYTFKNVPAGQYEVEAKYISYKDEDKDITLKDGDIAIVKLQLEAKHSELKEVVIGAKASAETDQSARRVEQRSDQVLNAVSAKTIEASPDITVANVMQRVSGVSIERSNNGEGQYAIIRGMEKRYTYTLVNGYKIPSPDNKNRYIPLDIFPSDIIARLEVYKSPTPAQEGDAIAGGTNLVLKDAPDDFSMKINLGVGLSQSVIDNGFTKAKNQTISVDPSGRSPRILKGDNYIPTLTDFSYNGQRFTNSKLPVGTIANISVGGRSADKKFGALVSLSYQNIYKDTKSVVFGADVDADSKPTLTDITRRIYNIEQERAAGIGRFDYRFNSKNKLTLDADYINLNQNLYRYSSDTSLTLARTGFGQGRVTEGPRSQRVEQKIANFALHGDHQLSDDFSINYTGIYSRATANENRFDLALITGRIPNGGVVVQAPLTIDALKGQTQTFGFNTDQDKSGYLNGVYKPKLFGTDVTVTAGGMYRNKTRKSTFDQYTLGLGGSSTQVYDGNIDHNTFALSTLVTGSDPLNYDITENVGAAYGQLKFNISKLEVLGGVRYEHTNQKWLDALDPKFEGKTGDIKYGDLLPSLNLKYALSDKQNVRASYYSAISRPNFYEIIPHTSGDPEADYQEVGNPHLKHATADNFDLRYEFFPKALDQLLVGVFYKRIENPIEYGLVNTFAAGSNFVLQANNFGTAKNYGFEADFTKYINKFGFRANYSFTDSKITTSKAQKFRDASGGVTTRNVDQTRPLQGQSKHIGNLSFLYKDTKSGFDAQISAVYTGERINSVSIYVDNDIWQKSFVTLDLSAEKKLWKGIHVYAKATNLLNTPYQLFIKQPYPQSGSFGTTGQPLEYQAAGKNTFIRKDSYQQYYILGVNYKF